MWMIFPLPFPPAPTAPTSDYFRQPFFQLSLGLKREGFPSAFLKPNLYIGAPPDRGILRGPPVPPPIYLDGQLFHPSKCLRWLGYWLLEEQSTSAHFSRRLVL